MFNDEVVCFGRSYKGFRVNFRWVVAAKVAAGALSVVEFFYIANDPSFHLFCFWVEMDRRFCIYFVCQRPVNEACEWESAERVFAAFFPFLLLFSSLRPWWVSRMLGCIPATSSCALELVLITGIWLTGEFLVWLNIESHGWNIAENLQHFFPFSISVLLFSFYPWWSASIFVLILQWNCMFSQWLIVRILAVGEYVCMMN